MPTPFQTSAVQWVSLDHIIVYDTAHSFGENVFPQFCTVGDFYYFQVCTIIESVIIDSLHRLGDGYREQTVTTGERTKADAFR